ncbi:hypothetical protein KY386_03575 [Candidatus Parcubacteria bacterium]|nr:hypothetical protein [Candidatus Parcubacteria bacterium]
MELFLGGVNYLLLLHLAGAAATLLLAVVTVWRVWRSRAGYRSGAIGLAVLGLLQIITGAWLAASAGTSVGAFCRRGALYLAVLAVIELWLYTKATRQGRAFPVRLVVGSFAGSFAIIGVTLARLF